MEIVGPIEKTLACKEVGGGALAHVENIVRATRRAVEPLHNIAPYLADEDSSSLTNEKQIINSVLKITNNIPYQVWKMKLEQQALSDAKHSMELQISYHLEQEIIATERNEIEDRLNSLHFGFRLVIFPAALLIIGMLRQLQEVRK